MTEHPLDDFVDTPDEVDDATVEQVTQRAAETQNTTGEVCLSPQIPPRRPSHAPSTTSRTRASGGAATAMSTPPDHTSN